jgi:SAM-dependent methyltransferase
LPPAFSLLPSPEADWAVALFNRSVLKQAKFRQIESLLEDPAGKTNLDIGADNGVISYLLRRRGGQWHSADLDETTVASIRQLVGENVHRLDGARTPFPDHAFDQVVVVDYLEHIQDDHGFGRELARIVRPGGCVIINVPHLRPGSLLNRFRHSIGLTDEWHGHLRPGYDVTGLRALLGPSFEIERYSTYSGTFSELIDTGLNGLYLRMQRKKTQSRKGTVITQSDLQKHKKQFVLLSALYPLLWMVSKLDDLVRFRPGYKLIVRARRTDGRADSPRLLPDRPA